ncbi:nonstructural protein [Sand fever Naples-like virus]|uniref:Nonstructural protein n=2 Tax=Phlebovirus napoliense TaxID=3052666 RepID=A7KCM5_9VIRU|nr:nonstructural protein [Sandfly fever Naples virus]AEL29676.1 nonstructural protein [Sand fever Naples-like virus]
MQSSLVFLKPKSSKDRNRKFPRFYVNVKMGKFDPLKRFCLLESEIPIYVDKYKVVLDSRPTLSHFLSKKEFPAFVGYDSITGQRTKLYDPTIQELFGESINSLKRHKVDFLLSALRWPTGVPSLEFIEYYLDDHIFLSDEPDLVMSKYLKLLVKASGLFNTSIEDQIVEVHRKTLMEGMKYGLTKEDLPGNDLIGELCVVQAARVASSVAKSVNRGINDLRFQIYFSVSPVELHLVKRSRKVDKTRGLARMSSDESYRFFLNNSESFRKNALSTTWTKDWPTPGEQLYKGKSSSKLRLWLPSPPTFPPI